MRPAELGPDADAIAATAAAIADRYIGATGPGVGPDAWAALADAGTLGLGTPEGGGGAAEVVAVHEALGGRLSPGPLIATLLAVQLLDGDDRAALTAGQGRAGVVVGSVLVDSADATHLVELDGATAFLVAPTGPLRPMASVGGEPWARLASGSSWNRTRALAGAPDGTAPALALADLAASAWALGAAGRVLGDAVDHVKGREQFGRPLASFQAVAHRLARARAEVDAARNQVVLAALAYDTIGASRARAAAARLVASQVALDAAFAAHQCCGALGFTVEAGLGSITAGIRRCASLPPSGAEATAAVVADVDLELARF